MHSIVRRLTVLVGVAGIANAVTLSGWANGGPFVVRYPSGDPSAKGVLARLDPGLKPAREERLRVINEDLEIVFDPPWETVFASHRVELKVTPATNSAWGTSAFAYGARPQIRSGADVPLVRVSASYRIENPTDQAIEADFGFPILRGIYIRPDGMTLIPEVRVTADGKHVPADIISNSAIYGLIRRHARSTIERVIETDSKLETLVKAVRESLGAARNEARQALAKHLNSDRKWPDRNATLLVEYAGMDLGNRFFVGSNSFYTSDRELNEIVRENLGILAAIGEQKATQLFAHLAGLLDRPAAASYETIFTAWGGDVRERSVDLATGKVRPREVIVQQQQPNHWERGIDATVYARVDYLDPNAALTDEEKASCKAILQNLPVIFTFAPMNLLHYQVKFAPKSQQTVTVKYSQYAYQDTARPSSYQIAYVVHPASLWKEFGPIKLTVKAPESVTTKTSVASARDGFEERSPSSVLFAGKKERYAVYCGTLTEKTGEIFIGVDASEWKQHLPTVEKAQQPTKAGGF